MEDRGRTTQLLRQARDGVPHAVDLLYDRIGARLLALVRLRLDATTARYTEPEDVVQEVLLKAFRHIGDFEKDTSRSFFAWLAIIASNTIRDLRAGLLQQKRDARLTTSADQVSMEIADTHRSAVSRIIIDEKLSRLEHALAALKPRHREIILLRRFEERSFPEIGAVMDLKEDAARMLFTRAMAALTRSMEP